MPETGEMGRQELQAMVEQFVISELCPPSIARSRPIPRLEGMEGRAAKPEQQRLRDSPAREQQEALAQEEPFTALTRFLLNAALLPSIEPRVATARLEGCCRAEMDLQEKPVQADLAPAYLTWVMDLP